MSNPVPNCAHLKANGEVCGSPAVSGTALCYHHSAVKTALKPHPDARPGDGGFAPIPFVFPEDRASMQINFFLLLQAYNEQRIDQRAYNSMLSLLKSMSRNLGKTGKLTEDKEPEAQEKRREARAQREDSNDIPPGYAGDPQRQIDREREEEQRAKKTPQQAGSGTSIAELSAAWDSLPTSGPIAPEICFSTKSPARAIRF